jgi:hypothetical protein
MKLLKNTNIAIFLFVNQLFIQDAKLLENFLGLLTKNLVISRYESHELTCCRQKWVYKHA